MQQHIANSLREAQEGLDKLINNQNTLDSIARAAEALIATLSQGGKIISCGNGGSMCDAMHFAEELTGKYRNPRKGLPAMAISDSGHLSCVGNDYGYNEVFARFIEAHGKSGDCLVAISTSGNSQNILRAVEAAQQIGMTVIGLSGKLGSTLPSRADVSICTPAGSFADRVQELHIKILHILIEMIERQLFPENY